MINFKDEGLSRFFGEYGWEGEPLEASQDYLFVTDTNTGASKANFYVKRTLNYEANLLQNEALLTINYVHSGKSNAWPGGPYENLLRVVIPEGTELISTHISQDNVESKGEEVTQEIEIMGLFLTKTFQRNFRKLPDSVQTQIEEALREIYRNPSLGKKLLGELEGEYSHRVGRYRIIYFIDRERNTNLCN